MHHLCVSRQVELLCGKRTDVLVVKRVPACGKAWIRKGMPWKLVPEDGIGASVSEGLTQRFVVTHAHRVGDLESHMECGNGCDMIRQVEPEEDARWFA